MLNNETFPLRSKVIPYKHAIYEIPYLVIPAPLKYDEESSDDNDDVSNVYVSEESDSNTHITDLDSLDDQSEDSLIDQHTYALSQIQYHVYWKSQEEYCAISYVINPILDPYIPRLYNNNTYMCTYNTISKSTMWHVVQCNLGRNGNYEPIFLNNAYVQSATEWSDNSDNNTPPNKQLIEDLLPRIANKLHDDSQYYFVQPTYRIAPCVIRDILKFIECHAFLSILNACIDRLIFHNPFNLNILMLFRTSFERNAIGSSIALLSVYTACYNMFDQTAEYEIMDALWYKGNGCTDTELNFYRCLVVISLAIPVYLQHSNVYETINSVMLGLGFFSLLLNPSIFNTMHDKVFYPTIEERQML